jgi:hypothetical protein
MTEEDVREARLRRMLQRRGFVLQKSRARDPGAVTYGGYQIVDTNVGGVVGGEGSFGYAFDLDEVAAWIVEHDKGEGR